MNPPELNLALDEPQTLSQQRRTRWNEMLSSMDGGVVGTDLIFLAELLEILDPGQQCRFRGDAHSNSDGTGGMRWSLSTANLSIRRVFEQGYQRLWEPENNDVWDHLEVTQDSTEIDGFDGDVTLNWDGRVGDIQRPLHLVLSGIDNAIVSRILALARELFAAVEQLHRPFAVAEPKDDQEPPGMPSLPSEGYAVVKLHYSQGFDLCSIVPVAYFATLSEAEAYFKDHSYDSTDPNGWTDRVERRLVRIHHGRYYDRTSGSRIDDETL